MEKRHRLYGEQVESLKVDFKKKKRVNADPRSSPERPAAPAREAPNDYVFVPEIVDAMRACAARCRAMEQHLVYHPQFEDEIARVCTAFFASFTLPVAPAAGDPRPRGFIEPREKPMDDAHEEPLAKYL